MAELFIAALGYHQRAQMVGERSAGKATGYHFYSISETQYLHVADVQYLHPGGRTWHEIGIEPSVVVRSSGVLSGQKIDIQLETIFKLLDHR